MPTLQILVPFAVCLTDEHMDTLKTEAVERWDEEAARHGRTRDGDLTFHTIDKGTLTLSPNSSLDLQASNLRVMIVQGDVVHSTK